MRRAGEPEPGLGHLGPHVRVDRRAGRLRRPVRPGRPVLRPRDPWTTDLHKVARDTDAIFPDWNQRVDRIRGGEDWAVFEWTGTATFHAGEGKAGVPISMTGATVIDVDGDGKVTAWRDYLDTNEPTQQITAGLERALEGG